MRILDKAVFVGPSLYAHFPVIRLDIDLGELEDWPSGKLGTRFTTSLLDALPGLHDHTCSYGRAGGFVRRLTEGEGTWMGHILEHVAIELQNVAGEKVTFGKTRSHGPRGHYYVVYQYEQEDVGLEAGRLGLALLHSLLPRELRSEGAVPEGAVPEGFDFGTERDDFIRFTQRRALGPSTMALVRAAEERRIPWIRLNDQSLIQFGHGRYQQRIQATVTSRTSHIAVELASDKEETNRILGNLGLPVPRQRLVQTVEDAMEAAERIGYPVVVKPYNANHGRGISIHLTDADQVGAAFEIAQQHSRSVIVESFISGEDHRMLVINGELAAVAKRVPGHVVGDGIHTIEQLVEEVNRDPRRGVGHEKVLTRLLFDHQAETLLAKHGYTTESIPASGERVFLRSTGNLSTGGTATDMTDLVHPDNIEMAVRAVKAIGLDVGGVDFLTTDVTESYKEVGGAICEVNAAPGFRMHMAPSEGQPRDVGGRVMDMLFPPGTPSRIPIAAVTGTNGKTTTARMLAHIQKLAGHHVGLTSTDGVYIDGQRTVSGDMTGPVATRMVLSDPTVDVAVLEVARGGLLRAGMGVRHCDVGAVLNVKADHLGLRGIGTLDQLAEVKRIVVEVARETAVLNADDPLCLKMADYTEAQHLCYVTMNPAHELVSEHIKEGGRGVVLETGIKGQMITIYDHGAHIPLLWTHLIPATLEGRALHNVQNAMFAAAMAFSMGLKLEDIRHGLRTFDTTFFQAPGRMNIYDEHPFKVILDYGHNPAAVEAMCQLVERLDVMGRRLCVLAVPGDRRDQDIFEIGRIAAGRFERYICRRDDNLRGRRPEEVPELLRESLLAHGVPAERIDVIPSEQSAVDAALRSAEPGDLLLIFADAITRSWKQVIQFRPDAPAPQEERRRPSRPEPVLVDVAPVLDGGRRVRDSRGVRIPREETED
ncbi:MAG TPA: cyanophycin synthetase [Gemmatimonadales bacterium]|nr:cyanophycin synthetase [Gemmatimonadales bacterium]